MSFLKTYYDPEAVYPEGWTRREIVEEQMERLIKLAYIANRAADRKRRIGRDASYAEMAQDKKRCRRIAHAARTLERAWFTEIEDDIEGVYVVPMSDEEKLKMHRLAGIINWESELSEWTSCLLDSISRVVSWAVDNGHKKFGNRCLNRLLAEIERMTMAVEG